MKQIFSEISTIDQNLLKFQEANINLNVFKQKNEQDAIANKQKAESVYFQTIENINQQKKQLESSYVQIISECKRMRQVVETNAHTQYSLSEQNINSSCNNIIQNNKKTIAWIEYCVAEMPPKMVKKVVSGPKIAPAVVEKRELEKIYTRIFDGSLRAGVNRTLHLDGYLPKAKMIQEFLEKAIAYKLHLENEIKKVAAKQITDIDQAYQTALKKKQREINQIMLQENNASEVRKRALDEFNVQMAAALKKKYADLDSVAQEKIRSDKEIVVRRNNNASAVNTFFNSTLVTKFTERVKRKIVGTGAINSDWVSFDAHAKYPKYSIGSILLPIKTKDAALVSALQGQLKNAIVDNAFKIPLILNSNESTKFFVNYSSCDKNAVYEFVQGIVLQRLRCAEAGNVEVYFAEPDKSGRVLGPISAKIQENEAIGIYNINSKDSIKDALKQITKEFDVINGLLGSYRSIYEYNENCKPYIKERCLILSDVGGVFDKEDWELLKVIWNNSYKCGVTIVILSSHSISNISALYPHMNVDVSFLNSSDLYLVNCINDKCTIKHGNNEYGFVMSKMTDARKAFVDLYRKAANDYQNVDSKFSSHFDATKAYHYRNSTNAISLPIMLRNYPGGDKFEFVIDSQTRPHTLLTGGTGSGKTTFLHMLISSIVMNYHPDDVEIWLVDYGIVSFKKYVHTRPGHIRFVALEKTEEFTYSFLEYVKAYFSNRERIFRNANVQNIEEYRAKFGDLSMPRVVLIIDEFHVMTQHTKNSMSHYTILENILREYRKFGLSCIFSDQTCNTGLKEDGMKQIANRLAMRQNNMNDIIETLGVAKDNFTQDQLHKMERTQRGEIWCKEYASNSTSDFTIEYFKSIFADENALQNVLETSRKRNDVVKHDKKVYVIDGKDRKMINIGGISKVVSTFNPAEIRFCIGVPSSIEPFCCFDVEQRYANNILVAGRNSIIGADVLAQLLLSALLSGNNKVLIFSDPREKKLAEVMMLTEMLNVSDKIEVCTDYNSMCAKIKAYSNQLKRREQLLNTTLILWLGIIDIYDELSLYGEYVEPKDDSTESFEVSEARVAIACSDEELLKIAEEQFGVSALEIIQMLGSTEENVEAESLKPKAEEGVVYNAIADINTMLSMGGRYSLFNIVALENSNDIKRLKDFKLDNFIHKIGYAMSGEDSWGFGFGKKAEIIEEDDMAVYTNGVRNYMFKPFLLKK